MHKAYKPSGGGNNKGDKKYEGRWRGITSPL